MFPAGDSPEQSAPVQLQCPHGILQVKNAQPSPTAL
jgi:hypothetical protein